MVNSPSNSSEQPDQYSHDELTCALDLDVEKLLHAAKNAKILERIIKEIIVSNEMEKSNSQNLSRTDWREKMFSERVEEMFIQKKASLERVSFWYLTIDDKSEAMEMYYQLCNNEITFSEVQKLNPSVRFFNEKLITKLEKFMSLALSKSKVNVPIKPIRTKKGFLILQKQSVSLITLDNKIRNNILKELEESWFRRELDRLLEK